jgi:hypothetical protein
VGFCDAVAKGRGKWSSPNDYKTERNQALASKNQRLQRASMIARAHVYGDVTVGELEMGATAKGRRSFHGKSSMTRERACTHNPKSC